MTTGVTVALGDISAFITKGATPTTYGFQWEASGVPFLRSECVSDRGLDMAQSMSISQAANAALRRSQVADGDILMTITGYVGRVIRLSGLGIGNINQHIARIRVTDPRFDSAYVYHYLSQGSIRAYYESIVTGQAYPQISLMQVRETTIPALPLAEQRAIARVLDDADALIVALERRIAKQQAIKQGMTLQLLSGRTRLPGFGGPWTTAQLGELGRWRGGTTPSMGNSLYWNPGEVPWASSGDVKMAHLASTASSISERAIKEGAATLVPAGSLVVVIRSGILRRYFPVALIARPMAVNQDIKVLVTNDKAAPEFLLHALQSNGAKILAACLKSGTTVESIEFYWLKAFSISLPPRPEQVAIAAVLDDAEAEIRLLQTRLAKAQAVKQGLMQKLLIGRTRLPVGEAAA